MCKVLEVSRSRYYDWLKIKNKIEIIKNEFEEQIIEVFERSNCTYGSPRIAIQLTNDLGKKVSKTTVAIAMKNKGIIARKKRKFKTQQTQNTIFLLLQTYLTETLRQRNWEQNGLETSLILE